MALTFTQLADGYSPGDGGTLTSGTFTPTAGKRLIVVCHTQQGVDDTPPTPTPSCSQGGVTWDLLLVHTSDTGYFWNQLLAIWISSPVAATAGTTVSVALYWSDSYGSCIVGETEGVDVEIIGTVTGWDNYAGAQEFDYSSAAASGDLALFAAHLDDSAWPGLDMSAGWSTTTTAYEYEYLSLAYRSDLTSTDISVDTFGNIQSAVTAGVVLREAAGGGAVSPPPITAHQRLARNMYPRRTRRAA